MATQVQRRKGTTAQHSTFTGAIAELTVDTTKNTVVVHDGVTAGGTPLAKESGSALSPSSLTFSGGTANGVAYLNGSKVLTTGSALTFDGTKLTSPSIRIGGSLGLSSLFEVYSPNYGVLAAFRSVPGDGVNPYLLISSSASGITFEENGSSYGSFMWKTNASEQMRLTSTGLGIGTSSPTDRLEVAGVAVAGSVSNGTNGSLVLRSRESLDYTRLSVGTLRSSGAVYFGRSVVPSTTVAEGFNGGFTGTVGGGAWTIYDDGSTRYLGLPTGPITKGSAVTLTERMRIDSSGNLGLGVTPSAWATSFSQKAIQFSDKSALSADTNTATLSQNAVKLAGGWTYLASTFALRYDVNNSSGQHAWFTAPSGTAGNAISFTQAMTLDASGRLLLGTTTPLGAITSTNASGYIGLSTYTTGGSISEHTYVNAAGLQIDSYQSVSGSPYTKTTDIVANADSGASAQMRFFTTSAGSAPSERARIDSSGNLLVGTTSNQLGGKLSVVGISTLKDVTTPLYVWNSNTTGTRTLIDFETNAGGTNVGTVTTNGTTTSYNTSSDYRLKNITGPVTNSGAYIDSLNPVEGTWKADGSTFVGLIAHEVQEASRTQVATGVKDGEQMQGMDYSSAEIIANLIAEVKALRTRVAALEAA